MKPNVLLTASSVYLALVGLSLLFVPDAMMSGALGGSAPPMLVATVCTLGSTLLAIASLNFLARKAAYTIYRLCVPTVATTLTRGS